MYIIKNAWTNIKRNKGRNVLIGIIITIVTISSYISLAIKTSSDNLVTSYKNSNPLEVTLGINMQNLRQNKADSSFEPIPSLTVDDIKSYGESTYVKDYYYYYSVSLSSDDITALSMNDFFKENDEENNNMPKMDKNDMKPSEEDFKFSAYSDIKYIESFIDGDNKIVEGEMFDSDTSDHVIVISSDLAEENDIEVGETINFYSSNNSDNKIELTVIGIYEDSTDNTENFMNMNAMVSSNQIYTTLAVMDEILALKDSTINSLNAKFYLYSSDDFDTYTKELSDKGLSEYYSVNNNIDTILATLEPIENISQFSVTFLFVICIVAIIVIGILTMINIRDRKYEIGVLRAIGMSKLKVMLQLLLEITVITCIAIILGIGIGAIVSQPVTDIMLKNEIQNYTEEQTQIKDNFGGKDFNHNEMKKPGEMNPVDSYVDTLTVNIKGITILEVAGISLLITLLCGMLSIIYVNRFSPNKILQNRN